MPDDKKDGSDFDEDPFEGIEVGDDAPEPTQEEMDEWATLDTPDEEGSPVVPSQEAKASGKPATAPAPAVAEPAPPAPVYEPEEKEVPVKQKEEKQEKPVESRSTPASATEAAQGEEQQAEIVQTAAPVKAIPPPPIAMPAPAPAVELSEIVPSVSPSVPQRPTAGKSTSADEYEDENPLYGREDGMRAGDDGQGHSGRQRQQQHSGGGWGGGWGSGWGLGALSGKLREVAAGAVRDVKDLTETFQAALADVTGAEDEVETARLISERDRAAEFKAAGAPPPQPDDSYLSSEAPVLPTDAPRQLSEPARESLISGAGGSRGAVRGSGGGGARSSAGGAGDGAGGTAPADPALEVGLQAIDAQVEQLATGAARAFTSLWGGLSSVAKVVAAEVAASVADVQSSEAVRGVAKIGTKLAHTAEKGLETVGRTAMVLLEEVAGVGGGAPGRRRIWGEEADARAADMGREPSTFQDFFYIYGGEQLAEEVTNLSNECAHLCNRSRSKLEADQQQALDDALSRLGPYFNDPWIPAGSTAAAAEAAGGLPALDDSSREAAERLSHMYDPIGYLCQDSQSRSEAYLHQLVDAVETARQEKRQQQGKKGRRSAPKDEERQSLLQESRDAEEAAKEDAAEEEGDEDWQQLRGDARPLLLSFRAHFTKRLAEVATAQLQLLINLGASLAAPARTGRPAVDGIAWPDSSEQQAALLAAEARRMVADLATIVEAYRATINSLKAHFEATKEAADSATAPEAASAASSEAAEGQESHAAAAAATEEDVIDEAMIGELSAALASAYGSASSSIKNGYKGLLYAVLLRSLVTQIAQEREAGEEEGEEETEGANKEGAEGEGGDAATGIVDKVEGTDTKLAQEGSGEEVSGPAEGSAKPGAV